MRNFLIWTLSILLGFEPALWAQGSAHQQAEIKAFIEKNNLAQRPVTVRELYEKNSNLLPFVEQESLKNFISNYGDMKLPKMDVSKVRGQGGKDFYQIQGIQNGKSISMEIINEGGVFARLNGKTLTFDDMKTVPGLMAKLGVPESEIQKNFSRSPASAKSPILSAEQLMKLSPKDRIQYFKQLRQLLESMEAVEGSFEKHKTSSVNFSNKFEVIARWLQGEPAFARTEGQCVAAGWMAKYGPDKSGHTKCGTDGANGVAEEYRQKADGTLCPKDKFACNPAIYGGGKGADLCIPGSRDTTRLCNERVVGEDIPDLAKTADEFEKLRVGAVAESEKVIALCGGSTDSNDDLPPEEDVPAAPAKKKAGKKAGKKSSAKKKSSGNPLAGLDEDQRETCKNFQKRYDDIHAWGCGNKDFAGKYPQLCEKKPDVKPDPVPPVAQTPPLAPTPSPAPPAGPRKCDELPLNQAPVGTACNGEITQLTGPGNITCIDASGNEVRVAQCKCDSGQPVSRFKCPDSGVTAGGETIGGKRSKKEKEGPNWLLYGAFGLGGILLFYWLNKKAVDQQYQQIQPVPPAPPVAPPNQITVPQPRGVN